MAKPAKSTPTRSVRLLDGPPKKSLASLGVRTPPPSEEEEDHTPAASRTAERLVNGIRIEAGIPVPSNRGGGIPMLVPVLQALALNESFLMAGVKTAHRVYTAKKHVPGKKFICHTVKGGVRCWRIE